MNDIMIENPNVEETLKRQQAFFATGKTKDVSFRIKQLKKLRSAILAHEQELYDAFWQDLRKPRYEVYMTEIGSVLKEIRAFTHHLRLWASPKIIPTPMEHLPAISMIYREPLGVVLIVSPWNYPFNLAVAPLIGAIAGGNCAVLKTGHASRHVSAVLTKLLRSVFPSEYVAVFQGGRDVNKALFDQKYDSMFFTGSTHLGRIAMEAAAKNVTPITLELGGKSPVIVCNDADIKIAARRIMWGKLINNGQTCIAPDYLLVQSGVREKLFDYMRAAVRKSYGDDPQQSPFYGRIINDDQFQRLEKLISSGDIVFGGNTDADDRYIEPTLLENVTLDDPVMQEEIFGPILPAIEFDELDEAITLINNHPTPLALYLFTRSLKTEKRVINSVSYGGGCVNDVIMHIATNLPFGGVGQSGTGRYHGKASFETFTYEKSVMKNFTFIDLPLRYAPYKDFFLHAVKMVMR